MNLSPKKKSLQGARSEGDKKSQDFKSQNLTLRPVWHNYFLSPFSLAVWSDYYYVIVIFILGLVYIFTTATSSQDDTNLWILWPHLQS